MFAKTMKVLWSAIVLVYSSVLIDGFSVVRNTQRGLVRSSIRLRSSSGVEDSGEEERVSLRIALTREVGKNDKIRDVINAHPMLDILLKNNKNVDMKIEELPCIEHMEGPDLLTLKTLAQSGQLWTDYDYILLTSPEATKVFQNTVKEIPSSSKIQFAAVGKATRKALNLPEGDIEVFCPSKANGETLAKELPPVLSSNEDNDKDKPTRILYPASAKAANTIRDELKARTDGNFELTRLNTYDTVSANFTSQQIDLMMDDIDIACFGSPSAVQAWIENVDTALGTNDTKSNGNVVAACIGTTTARACLESQRWQAQNIYYPSKNPGMEGWAESILQSIHDTIEAKFWSSW